MSKPITKLKVLREKQLLTQDQLAKRSKVAIGVISNAENGKRISLASIKKIAAGLNLAPEKLL